MARWKLSEKHYIYTDPPTEWEQVEVDLSTGEQVRKRFIVPKMLDPDDPKLQNAEGMVVVCQGKKESPKDILFIGFPTPAMLPMDEEAQGITDAMSAGQHPIESLDSTIPDSPPALKTLQAQINALMLANDELQRRIAVTEAQQAGDVQTDIAAIAAQQPKVAKERRT